MKKIYITLLILVVLIFISTISVNAFDTKFETSQLSADKIEDFRSRVNVVASDQVCQIDKIECFNVSEDGFVALGGSALDYKSIQIYDSDGSFVRSYQFHTSGTFGIEFVQNDVAIYFVRSDIVALIDEDGNMIDAKRVSDTRQNNTYRNDLLHLNKRSVNGATYYLAGYIPLGSYTKMICEDVAGNKTVFFDCESQVKLLILFFAVIVFLIICILLVRKQFLYSKTARNRKRKCQSP